jgi:hypothetical protein
MLDSKFLLPDVSATCEWWIWWNAGSIGVGTGVMWIIGPWVIES